MASTILMIGTFDTKGIEFAYLREQLLTCGHEVLSVDVGIMGSPDGLKAEIDANTIAQAGGSDISMLREAKNRDITMDVMCKGASSVIRSLFDEGRFQAIIGMGGGGGTSIVTAAMRALPLGIPKVCISTVASGDVSSYLGTKDIVMFPSLVDLAGINRLSRVVIAQAAGAISGMVQVQIPSTKKNDTPVVAATMFGNTTQCVQACAQRLREHGFEVMIFHATGTGGKMMETLIREGHIDAVLDLTTTELADEVCGGIMSAGDTRLTAAAEKGIPQVVAPGCIDMVNFGPQITVPLRYKQAKRTFYQWNPNNTLMRTSIEESLIIGEQIACRLNASTGPVGIVLPLRGLSILGEEGQPFCNKQADHGLIKTIKEKVKPSIQVIEMDTSINHPKFSEKAVEMLLNLMN
jgi:uncharacterized protein (UPF0261 family)